MPQQVWLRHAGNIRRGCPFQNRMHALMEMGAWNTMFEDLRYSLRVLVRSPSFTLVAVMGLALGIGANSAIFTAMNAVLLRPLPCKDADQLVLLWQLNRHNGDHEVKASAPDYIDWKEQNSVFQEIAAFNANSGLGLNLSGVGQSGAR